jgi:phosphatidylcholine synthase
MPLPFIMQLMIKIPPPSNPKIRSIYAYGVHAFTATGAVWGFLGLLAVINHDWKAMMVFIVLATFVDGFDGFLARWADTKTYAPGVDGALMDNIIDYLTYVVLPALFLYEANVLPEGWKLFGACSILLTSAYQFSQTDAKTDDHYFKGFPSYWNVVILYMLILGLNPVFNLVALLLLNVLVFVPIKWIYPSRTNRLPRLTVALTLVFGIVGVLGLILYPNVPAWVVWITFAYIVYYVVLSLLPDNPSKKVSLQDDPYRPGS